MRRTEVFTGFLHAFQGNRRPLAVQQCPCLFIPYIHQEFPGFVEVAVNILGPVRIGVDHYRDVAFNRFGENPRRGVNLGERLPGDGAGIYLHDDSAAGENIQGAAHLSAIPRRGLGEDIIVPVPFFYQIKVTQEGKTAKADEFGDSRVVRLAQGLGGTAVNLVNKPAEFFQRSNPRSGTSGSCPNLPCCGPILPRSTRFRAAHLASPGA